MADSRDKILEIKKNVSNTSIFINRIPKKTKAEFVSLAKEEFEGDYGMVVKWLIDFRKGLLSSPNQILMEQMDLMADEIASLKSEPKEKKKAIRSVAGTKIAEKEE